MEQGTMFGFYKALQDLPLPALHYLSGLISYPPTANYSASATQDSLFL